MMEVMHSCRCCLQCPPDRGLTMPYPHLGKIEVYSDMLEECFDLHISLDGNEKCGICEECVGRLRNASDFKLQVQSSQERLQRALLVKAEKRVESETAAGDSKGESVFGMLHEVPIENSKMGGEDGTGDGAMPPSGSVANAKQPGLFTPPSPGPSTLHRPQDIPEAYTCDACAKHFTDKFNLIQHLQTPKCTADSQTKNHTFATNVTSNFDKKAI